MFLVSQGGTFGKHCWSKSVNAMAQVREPETGEVLLEMWRSESLEKKLPKEQYLPVSATH